MFLFVDLDHTIINAHTNNIIFDAIKKDPTLEGDDERQWALVEDKLLIGAPGESQKTFLELLNKGYEICMVSFSQYPHITSRILKEKIGLEQTVLDEIPVISYMPEYPEGADKSEHIKKGLEALAEKLLKKYINLKDTTSLEKDALLEKLKKLYVLLNYINPESEAYKNLKKAGMDKSVCKPPYGRPPYDCLREVILIDDSDTNLKGAKKAFYRTIKATDNGSHLKEMLAVKPYPESLEYIFDQARDEFHNFSSFEDKFIDPLFSAIQNLDLKEIGKILLDSITKNYEDNVLSCFDDDGGEEDDYTYLASEFLDCHRYRVQTSLDELSKIKALIDSLIEKAKLFAPTSIENAEAVNSTQPAAESTATMEAINSTSSTIESGDSEKSKRKLEEDFTDDSNSKKSKTSNPGDSLIVTQNIFSDPPQQKPLPIISQEMVENKKLFGRYSN